MNHDLKKRYKKVSLRDFDSRGVCRMSLIDFKILMQSIYFLVSSNININDSCHTTENYKKIMRKVPQCGGSFNIIHILLRSLTKIEAKHLERFLTDKKMTTTSTT